MERNWDRASDEFTLLVAAEVMRRFARSFLLITSSDMKVAHFGSYSMYLAGIRTVDRLQRNQSRCISKPQHSSRRDHQGAATEHETQQDTATLVPL